MIFGDLKMLRRELAPLSLATAAGLSLPALGWAQSAKPEDGVDFVSLDKPLRLDSAANKIEVTEFFWYKCPHCNKFEPALEAWVEKLPADVVFRRAPVAFRDEFVPQQRLFYALEAMGQIGKLHRKVFAAVHDQRVVLDNQEQITNWAVGQGLDRDAFTKQYDSFSVSSKSSKATQLMRDFKVSGVPSLGIAGKFYTDGAMARSMERALVVTDFLIAQERAARGSSVAAKGTKPAAKDAKASK
jgi:protein dithiol oxidoreductase (disulfide-forming)